MAKLKVISITKEYQQAENATVLEITAEIFNKVSNHDGTPVNEVIETRKFAFPMGTSEEELKGELKKFIDNYNAELESAKENAEQIEAEKVADATIAAVTGFEV